MKTQTFTIVLVLLLMISTILKAEHVETNDAATVGKNYYWENCNKTQSLSYDKVVLNLFSTKTYNDNSLYYIFNVNSADGFIIVSANDNTIPVLGYSTSGSWTGNNLPPAFDQMLNRFELQIAEVIDNNLEGDAEIDASWAKYQKMVPAVPESKGVTPMLITTWNQDNFYNQQCPVDAAGPGGHAYAGCVAVSMAQVMYFWQHPSTGIGTNSYVHPTYGTISANFATATYNYAAMPVSLSAVNFQVAQLMFHCGVSVDMNYGPYGSAPMGTYWDTDIEDALKNNFNYASTLQWKWKNNYTTATWISMLKADLNLGRPLVYYGWDGANMAHNFNCDGYNNSDYFHFNWGWGGLYDGYFPVTNLNPLSGYNFTFYQGAIFGMYPNQNPPQSNYDWGDAPDNPGYPTLSASSGAYHKVSTPPNLFLGSLIDTENDGQPHVNCAGDDNNNLDDEDGVVFPPMVAGSSVMININVFGSGFLNAWMDFNQDGDWADAGEQIFTNISITNGTNSLNLNIPASAFTGWTYARFRLSSQANLSYTGLATDGEVEDYFVRINEEEQTNNHQIIFSVDIGSDTEMSDPQFDMDEVFDPGDAYLLQGAYMPVPGTDGFFDDAGAFGFDPFPDGGVPGTMAPVMSGIPIEQVCADFFDLDGIDLAICDLRQLDFGEGLPPIAKFDEPYIHTADSLLISFDDDDAFPYTDPSGSIPVMGFSPNGSIYGQSATQDEIIEVDLNLSTPFPVPVLNLFPQYDEVAIHSNLTPDPNMAMPNQNEHDDDVDALDAPAGLDDLQRTYFSADHEATSFDAYGNLLNPGSIYLAEGGNAIEVINAQTNLGLPYGTDVDAFEFAWVDNPQWGYIALAVIFSVDENDPTTMVDESGLLFPNKLYVSFLDGWAFEFCTDFFEDDIDAIAIFGSPTLPSIPKADFSPINSTIYAGQVIQFTDLSTNAPTNWTWTFTGGNPLTFIGSTPPPVTYATPGTYQVSLTVANTNGTDTKTGSVQVLPANWQYTSTNISHIISIPLSANPSVNGVLLANGDMAGVFYTDFNGIEMCGGYAVWDGVNNVSVSAFCDDITTLAKDGFVNGEVLTWKVFTWSDATTHPVLVTYDQTLPNFDGNYYDWGVSALTSLNTCLTHSLVMLKGWKGASSYLAPANTNLSTMLAPVQSNMIIMQNFTGVYWPATGINTLNTWNPYDGYVVKMSQDAVLNIQGTALSNRTLNLNPGWQIIPVLSSSATTTSSLFNIPQIMLIKEVAGPKVYWPAMNITSLSMLLPGESYYVYVLSPVSISFPAKSAPAGTNPIMNYQTENSPWETVAPTPNSHLMLIPENVSSAFAQGDILGGFNKDGLCVGYTALSAKDNVLTLYGDDITTPEIDGMQENEPVIFRLYSPGSDNDILLHPEFDDQKPDSGNKFKSNGISAMSFITGLDEVNSFGELQLYPNPATDYIKVSLDESSSPLGNIQIINFIGVLILEVQSTNTSETIDVSSLPEGCYVLRVTKAGNTISKKIVIRK
ncbi:MAG: C10 family peptidase [Bacteroidales bacterium]|nr:C10 family peptidase [Bacteroidales bacterium]